jgi:hypothetical protein
MTIRAADRAFGLVGEATLKVVDRYFFSLVLPRRADRDAAR